MLRSRIALLFALALGCLLLPATARAQSQSRFLGSVPSSPPPIGAAAVSAGR